MSGETAQGVDAGALQLDRPCQRARTEGPGSPAPRYAHLRQALGRDCTEGDITEERIAHRHTVEQHQRSAGRIAAQRAQRRALRRSIGRTAVRTAELLETCDRAQRILDPARGYRHQLVTVDDLGIVGRRSGCLLQTAAGHDDHRIILGECWGSGAQRQRQAGTGHQAAKQGHGGRRNRWNAELRGPTNRLQHRAECLEIHTQEGEMRHD